MSFGALEEITFIMAKALMNQRHLPQMGGIYTLHGYKQKNVDKEGEV